MAISRLGWQDGRSSSVLCHRPCLGFNGLWVLSSGWFQGNDDRKGKGQVGVVSKNMGLLGVCEGSGKAVVYVDDHGDGRWMSQWVR